MTRSEETSKGHLRNVKPGTLTRCDNCGAVVPEEQLKKSLYQIDHLEDRLEPGCEIPAGECACGALAYIVKETSDSRDAKTMARMAAERELATPAERIRRIELARSRGFFLPPPLPESREIGP